MELGECLLEVVEVVWPVMWCCTNAVPFTYAVRGSLAGMAESLAS